MFYFEFKRVLEHFKHIKAGMLSIDRILRKEKRSFEILKTMAV